MKLTQRIIVLTMLAIGSLAATAIVLYYLFIIGNPTLAAVISINGVGGWLLTYVYWRGWEPARYIGAATCMLVSVTTPLISDMPLSFGMFISPIIVLILAGPRWMVGTSLMILIIGMARGALSFQQPIEVIYYCVVIVGLAIVHTMVGIALRDARENADAASQAREVAELQLQENVEQAQRLRQQNEQQQQLLSLVDSLETPTVALADGVILAPIVGALDTRRAERLTERLLKIVHTQRAELVILDITGVAVVDTGVAQAIRQTAQALRLLGCQVGLTGISVEIAMTLTQLGISFDDVQVARAPHEIIANMGSQAGLAVGVLSTRA